MDGIRRDPGPGSGQEEALLVSAENRIEAEVAPELPALPGAAATLQIASRALRATPLGVWREMVGTLDPEAPTREEAIQTRLGVARILSGCTEPNEAIPDPDPAPDPAPDPGP